MSTNEVTILRGIANKSETAMNFFKYMKSRRRHRGAMDTAKVKRFMRDMGLSVSDEEFEIVIQELVSAKFGKLHKDHNGRIDKFTTFHPEYDLGKAVIDGKTLPENSDKKVVEKKGRKSGSGSNKETPREAEVTAPIVKKSHLSLVADNTTTKTIIYFPSNGKNNKLIFTGDISEDVADSIIAQLKQGKSVAS